MQSVADTQTRLIELMQKVDENESIEPQVNQTKVED